MIRLLLLKRIESAKLGKNAIKKFAFVLFFKNLVGVPVRCPSAAQGETPEKVRRPAVGHGVFRQKPARQDCRKTCQRRTVDPPRIVLLYHPNSMRSEFPARLRHCPQGKFNFYFCLLTIIFIFKTVSNWGFQN